MKPGNLLSQGAKSGGRRKMRRLFAQRSDSSERVFFCFCVRYERTLENNGKKIVYF